MVFAVGFALGTARVLMVAPRIGPTLAVLAETPLILGASWYVSSACITRCHVDRTVAARIVMGVTAFVVLMTEEVSLSGILFGRPASEYLASLTAVPGLIGLTAQIAFAGFPLLQLLRPGRG